MKKSLIFAVSIGSVFGGALMSPLAYAGNIAACEVVLMEPVLDGEIDTGATMASFRPAAAFISSVYDDEEGYVSELDGYTIRGVMCTRKSVMPTLRDFPIVSTGVPFSMSENFDSTESSLMTVYYKDGAFQYDYRGRDLSEKEQAGLVDIIDVFNLQPHDLPPKVDVAKPDIAEKAEQ